MPHACTNCGRTFPDGSKEMLSGCPDCGGNKFRYHPGSVPESDAGGGQSADDASPRSPPNPDDEGLPGRDRGVVDRATTTVKDWVSQRSQPRGGPTAPERDDPATGDSSPASGTPPRSRSPSTADAASTGDAAPTQSSATEASASAASGSDPTADSDGGADADADTDAVRASMADSENTAQADARTGVADPDEITEGTPEDGPVTAPSPEDSGGAPDLGTAEREGPAPAGGAEAGAETQAREGAAEPADPAATPAASNLAQLREELNEQFESIKIVEPGEYELNLMGLYDREEYIISLMEDGRYAIEVPETWRDSEDLSD